MSQPIIGIYNADHSAVVSTWAVGEIKANSDSPTLVVNFWNNKGGTTAVSDMKETSVTCLDSDGNNVSEMTTGQWMKVRVDTTADVDSNSVKIFSAIGGDTTRPLRAQSLLAADGNVLRGTVNDGTAANSQANFSLATFKITIPFNATEGNHDFRIRVQGFYT